MVICTVVRGCSKSAGKSVHIHKGLVIEPTDVIGVMSFFHASFSYYTNNLSINDMLCFILRLRNPGFVDTLGLTRILCEFLQQ